MAVSSDRTRKQKITIQSSQVSSDLTNYVMTITRDHLHNEVVSPTDPLASQTDGGDIEFSSDASGDTRLACEIVNWEHDTSNAADDAAIEAHVLIPSVSSSTDTDIWIWYNTSGTSSQPAVGAAYGRNAVWTDYEIVWHMQEDPNGTAPQATDSSGNGEDGTSSGYSSDTRVAGPFGSKAWAFSNASTQYCQTNWSGEPAKFTWSCWVKRNDSAQDNNAAFMWQDYTGGQGIELMVSKTSGNLWWAHPHNWAVNLTGSTISDNTWAHVAMTFDSVTNGTVIYLNGSSVDTDATTGAFSTNPDTTPEFGGNTRATFELDGWMDEIKVANVERSAAYISAQYTNQNTPATFATSSTPQNVGCPSASKEFLDLSLNTAGTETSGYGGIALTATTSASPDIIHTSDNAPFDEIWVWVNNTNASALDVTFQTATGAGASRTEIGTINIPSKTGLTLVIPGLILNGGYRLEAFAPSNPGSINVFGFVNRYAT